MPPFLTSLFAPAPGALPEQIALRLVAAGVLGGLVAVIYRATRRGVAPQRSFIVTLVLLAILIAMVTQVVGDNVARAFSLVGALSIVRFRTVVRDTEDTAYVIFSVVVGMAAGAHDLWVGGLGVVIVGLAAWLTMGRAPKNGGSSGTMPAGCAPDGELTVRHGLDPEVSARVQAAMKTAGVPFVLSRFGTAKQGLAIDETYGIAAPDDAIVMRLVGTLNKLETVQDVSFQRIGAMDQESGRF